MADGLLALVTAPKLVVVTAFGVCIWFIRRYCAGGVCRNKVSLRGKTVLITGANTGVGKATAVELARRNARVIIACRSLERGQTAARQIRSEVKDGEVIVKQLELASLSSVRTFANEILQEEARLDILVNNAGVFGDPEKKTLDGFESQFGINHLGHFLLTNMLLELLVKSAPSRVIIVSSSLAFRSAINFDTLHRENISGMRAEKLYGQSKLANLLFAWELNKRLPKGVTVNSCTPGMVWTDLGRHMHFNPLIKCLVYPLAWLLLKRPCEGAQTLVHLATAEELSQVSGKYFKNCMEAELPPKAKDDGVAKKLWEVSEEFTQH